MIQRMIPYILLFAGFLLVFSWMDKGKTIDETGIFIKGYPKNTFTIGQHVQIDIENKTKEIIYFDDKSNPPITIKLDDKEIELTQIDKPFWPEMIKAGEIYRFSLDHWSNEIFQTSGSYIIKTKLKDIKNEESPTITISITEKGTFGKLWETLLIKPIYNVLIFVTTSTPGKSLGLGIILLTLLIRLVLLIPSQRALESQKKLSNIQPKIKEIQDKYPNDKAAQSQEIMELWKKHKVNPFGACLPMIIQLPILIALYAVVRDGLLMSSTRLLYLPLASVNISEISTNFLGILPLDKPNITVLPVLLVVMQFIQIKLSMAKKAKMPEGTPDPTAAMLYVLPAMIGVMSITFPAGIALYWGISTLFGIFQQLVVNREKMSQLG